MSRCALLSETDSGWKTNRDGSQYQKGLKTLTSRLVSVNLVKLLCRGPKAAAFCWARPWVGDKGTAIRKRWAQSAADKRRKCRGRDDFSLDKHSILKNHSPLEPLWRGKFGSPAKQSYSVLFHLLGKVFKKTRMKQSKGQQFVWRRILEYSFWTGRENSTKAHCAYCYGQTFIALLSFAKMTFYSAERFDPLLTPVTPPTGFPCSLRELQSVTLVVVPLEYICIYILHRLENIMQTQ